MPASSVPTLSAYQSAKLAQVKILEFLTAEEKRLDVVSVHPGTIDAGMFRSAGIDSSTMPMDTVDLPAHFLVWLSTSIARFLNVKTVWANWDVDELKAEAEESRAVRL
ncbi:hypothetical protein E8E12_000854 [Didymella heteroderae]|uniref:Uncharacterized protein n=1 Tax=Didymella heteroderae TaxID=1769908 RepID=A0A9P5BUI2_9PLEO|nr:hypothetical protein E8E12_000854 [Didymella heteroderae]